MSAAVLQRLRAPARRRAVAIVLTLGIPSVLVLATLAWRFATPTLAIAALVLGAVALTLFAWRRAAALDARWTVRALDARRRDLDDSSDLLLAEGAQLTALERLQLARLRARLESGTPPDLRAPWPLRALLACILLSAAAIAAALLWPVAADRDAGVPSPAIPASDPAVGPPRLLAQRLAIAPPAYTRLPRRELEVLDARVPEGSRLQWQLHFDPAPDAAELVFLDGRRVPLRRGDDGWHGGARIDAAGLYRIAGDDQPLLPERLYRIDTVPDLPPQLRITAPAANLVLRNAGQRLWSLAFEASDDHGIDARAELRITTAQGLGENISFREQQRTLHGSGGATRKRFAHRLDLAALGLAEGDDLIVQFAVRDNRAPRPQTTRSASYILRWPAPQPSPESGIEGLVRSTLPAYFRSQRQIIIDAEALQAKKPALAADDFVQRSDAIGVDQRLLRLRYGQFLGEESEGAPQRPLLPTHDAEDEAAAHAEEAGERPSSAPATSEDDHDDHGHADAAMDEDPSPGFGRAGNLLEEFGHTHDHAEAATLLDPETRTTLRAALDEMWQSELHLRQGRPDRALPYAYKALDYIKQVQQASRIYLGRVGSRLPPVDASRRMSGKREGLGDRRDPLPAVGRDEAAPAALWRALQPATIAGDVAVIDLDAFDAWLRANTTRVADPLALAAAVDRLRREPGCSDCRSELRALLWPLLDPPPAAPAARELPDRRGRAYLDALRQGDAR